MPHLLTDLAEKLDRRFGWDKLPLPLALPTLIGLRNRLRERNLYDTGRGPWSASWTGWFPTAARGRRPDAVEGRRKPLASVTLPTAVRRCLTIASAPFSSRTPFPLRSGSGFGQGGARVRLAVRLMRGSRSVSRG